MSQTFVEFEVNHIPGEKNVRADFLARLANTKGSGLNKTVIQEIMEALSIKVEEVITLNKQEVGCYLFFNI